MPGARTPGLRVTLGEGEGEGEGVMEGKTRSGYSREMFWGRGTPGREPRLEMDTFTAVSSTGWAGSLSWS